MPSTIALIGDFFDFPCYQISARDMYKMVPNPGLLLAELLDQSIDHPSIDENIVVASDRCAKPCLPTVKIG
jgi:hypothetical protein